MASDRLWALLLNDGRTGEEIFVESFTEKLSPNDSASLKKKFLTHGKTREKIVFIVKNILQTIKINNSKFLFQLNVFFLLNKKIFFPENKYNKKYGTNVYGI